MICITKRDCSDNENKSVEHGVSPSPENATGGGVYINFREKNPGPMASTTRENLNAREVQGLAKALEKLTIATGEQISHAILGSEEHVK